MDLAATETCPPVMILSTAGAHVHLLESVKPIITFKLELTWLYKLAAAPGQNKPCGCRKSMQSLESVLRAGADKADALNNLCAHIDICSCRCWSPA